MQSTNCLLYFCWLGLCVCGVRSPLEIRVYLSHVERDKIIDT